METPIKIDLQTLLGLIEDKKIEQVDLSHLDLTGLNFDGCQFTAVRFSDGERASEESVLKNISFRDCRFDRVSFDYLTFTNCDFDGKNTLFNRVSFKNCSVQKCRFRNATFQWCDFRYAEINQSTMEGTKIDFCDFYRAFFVGIVVMRNALISNSSLYYTYFDESVLLRKENLRDGRILQENKENYANFLTKWNEFGTGDRLSDQNRKADWSPDASLHNRFADAEDIFKTLNAFFQNKGFLADSNWAFVKGKKMERQHLWIEAYHKPHPWNKRIQYMLLGAWNFSSDVLFGYGESLGKMVRTYLLTVVIFAYFYYAAPGVSLASYFVAIVMSFKTMVAMSPDELQGVSPFVDFLNMLQTSLGILITGIFGFILGNKIRNQ